MTKRMEHRISRSCNNGLLIDPLSVAGARKLQPIWSQTHIKVLRFEEAYERARDRFMSILSKVGIALPQEVKDESNR